MLLSAVLPMLPCTIPAIAHEFGFEVDAETFDRMHRGAHYLLNIRPSGDWPAQYFYYAGGVPRVMEEIKDMLTSGCNDSYRQDLR